MVTFGDSGRYFTVLMSRQYKELQNMQYSYIKQATNYNHQIVEYGDTYIDEHAQNCGVVGE